MLWLKQAAACKVQQVLLKEIMDVSNVFLLKKGQKMSTETVYVVSLFIYEWYAFLNVPVYSTFLDGCAFHDLPKITQDSDNSAQNFVVLCLSLIST